MTGIVHSAEKTKVAALPGDLPTIVNSSILITMDMFDLVDIQRTPHPNVNKFSYTLKAVKMISRTDFFLYCEESKQFCNSTRKRKRHATASNTIDVDLSSEGSNIRFSPTYEVWDDKHTWEEIRAGQVSLLSC